MKNLNTYAWEGLIATPHHITLTQLLENVSLARTYCGISTQYEPHITADGYIIRGAGYTAGTGFNNEYIQNWWGDYDKLPNKKSIQLEFPKGSIPVSRSGSASSNYDWIFWAEKSQQ